MNQNNTNNIISNVDIPSQGFSFWRLFNPSYRSKEEIKTTYNAILAEKIEILKLNESSYDKLLGLYDSSEASLKVTSNELAQVRSKSATLEADLNTCKTQYDLVQKNNSSLSEALEKKTSQNTSLNKQIQELSNANKSLEETIEKQKNPLNPELLGSFVNNLSDKNYAKIKETILTYIFETTTGKLKDHGSDETKFKEDLNNLGLQNTKNNIGAQINIKRNMNRVGNSFDFDYANLCLDFENPVYYEAEKHRDFYMVTFKGKKSDDTFRTSRDEVELILQIPFDNQFFLNLREDAADFVKINLWGIAVNFIKKEDYHTSVKLIKNNDLFDLAMPFIQKNADNEKLMIYMKPVIDTYNTKTESSLQESLATLDTRNEPANEYLFRKMRENISLAYKN